MATIEEILSTLSLKHPLERTTCIGYSQRKPDCLNPVAIRYRSSAQTVLNQIKDELDRNLDVTNSLQRLVSLLLCTKNHQFQVAENVSRWTRELQSRRHSPRARVGNVTSLRSAQTTVPAVTSSPRSAATSATPDRKHSKEEGLRLSSDRALLREIKRRITSDKNLDLALRVIHYAEELRPADNDSTDDSDADTTSQQPDDEDEYASSQPSRQLLSSPNRLRRLTRSPEPLRQSHVQCGVCFLPYEPNGGDHWECTQCLNRVHQECFDTWFAAQVGLGQAVRCIHCRAHT